MSHAQAELTGVARARRAEESDEGSDDDLDAVSDEEMFRLIDKELGSV